MTNQTTISNDNDDKGGVAAVDRAILIIKALEGSSKAVTLSELSRLTGLYKSTLLRLLFSLERAVLVRKRADGRYVLGPFCARLGRAFNSTHHLQEHLAVSLERLVEAGTDSASFHVLYDDDHRLCLARVDSHYPTVDSIQAGDFLPINKGAAAKVIGHYTTHHSTGKPREEDDMPLIFQSKGERDPACAAVACPVFGPENEFIGALSISGPKERFTIASVKKMSALLLAEGRLLTEGLGGTWPDNTRKKK